MNWRSKPKILPMEASVDAALGNRRFVSTLLAVFDCLAVMLAIVGVVGVVSCTVEQRTQEIGIRIALGARKSDVIRVIVFGHAVRAGCGKTACPVR
jgi:putative ABC transport system permease protein